MTLTIEIGFVTFLFGFIASIDSATNKSADVNNRLYEHLVANQNKNFFHADTNGVPVNVTVAHTWSQLISLNAGDQTIGVLFAYTLNWIDHTLSWDPLDFGNKSRFQMPIDQIYIIDLFPSQVTDMKEAIPTTQQTATLFSNGSVAYMRAEIITSICPLSVDQFPFDNQTCTIRLTTWSLNDNDVQWLPSVSTDPFVLSQMGNGEWIGDGITVYLDPFTDENNVTTNDVCFVLSLRRRSTYYIAVVVVPTFLLASVCILGLFGPKPESDIGPDKIPLSLATLMSMTVLLSIASGSLPKMSTSLLGNYILMVIVLCAAAALVSVIISFTRSILLLVSVRNDKDTGRAIAGHTVKAIDAFQSDDSMKIKNGFFLSDFTDPIIRRLNAALESFEMQVAERKERLQITKQWSHLALKLNIGLIFVFMAINVAMLIYILQFNRT